MGFVSSKKQGQQIHTKRRAKERYGIDLNKDDRREIVKRIQANFNPNRESTTSACFLTAHSNRVTEWEVPYEGVELRVLYDKKRKSLITCLPPLDKKDDTSSE